VVNNSLAAADPTSTLLRLRAIGVLPQIDKVKKEHGTRLAMVPMLPTEPVGIPALEALSRTRVALTRWGPAMRAEGDPVDDPATGRPEAAVSGGHMLRLRFRHRDGGQPTRKYRI
jgi:hypothetical protein